MTTELKHARIFVVSMLDAAGYWHYKIAANRDAARKEMYAMMTTKIYKHVSYRDIVISKKNDLALYESYLASKNI